MLVLLRTTSKRPYGSRSYKKIKKYIEYKVIKDRVSSVHVSWFGGEPLLYFNEVVFPISLFAKDLCDSMKTPFMCSITTNASKINSDIIEKMKLIDLKHFQITLDGARKRHDKIRNENGQPSYDLIMNNIMDICLKMNDANITLRINYDDQTLKDKQLEEIFSYIPVEYRKKITPNFQRVWQTIKGKPTKNERRLELYNYCRNIGYKVCDPANVFQVGSYYKCYADRFNHLEINYDGKIYFCTARSLSEENVPGILMDNGRILWNESKVAKRYAKATFDNEMCIQCKYLPLCMGPCSQKIIETPIDQLSNICNLKISEIPPETVIIEYYKEKMKILSEK